MITDEELQFFDANEEIVSILDTSDSCSTSDKRIDSSFPYDVWIGSPKCVNERRGKFLNWMGINANQIPWGNPAPINCLEEELNKVRENNNGAVLQASGFVGDFRSNRSVSSFLSSPISDMSQSWCLRGNGNANECKRTSSDVSFMEENEKQRSVAGLAKRPNKGWLGRLRSMGCIMDRQCEANSFRAQDYSDAIFGLRRVKVKQYRKQSKELSALYKVQDFKAHEGSILTMKFSNDGKYLASAGEDGILRVWKILKDKRFRQPENDPSCIYFKVNDLSESKLKPMFMNEDKMGEKMSTRKKSDSACVVFPANVLRISEKSLHEFHGHAGEILDIAWSKKNYLISASVDKTVRLWRVGCDKCLGVFTHSNYVTSVQFNPVDKNYFISGSIDGKVRIWEISGCRVVDWADVRVIVTAVSYRPDGQGGIIGSLTGSCRLFNISNKQLELDAQICLDNKKKTVNKRIIGFQFFPQDPSKVMVSSADSQVRILHGLHVVSKYKCLRDAGTHTSASFTSDGKHVISACSDSNIYIWNSIEQKDLSVSRAKKIQYCERFNADASVAIPWCGFSHDISYQSLPFYSCSCFPLGEEHLSRPSPKGSATWPEETLPMNPFSLSKMNISKYKFLKGSYQSTYSSHAWGMVIVTAGWDGRIRSFQNYGLPVAT